MGNKIVLNFEKWTTTEFDRFAKAIAKNDLRAAYKLGHKVVAMWPYEVDPHDVATVTKRPEEGGLGMPEFMSVLKTIYKQASELINSKEACPNFAVDLNAWGYDDFEKFNSATSEDRLATVVDLLERVLIRHPFGDVPTGEPLVEGQQTGLSWHLERLNFEQLAEITRAIKFQINETFSEGS